MESKLKSAEPEKLDASSFFFLSLNIVTKSIFPLIIIIIFGDTSENLQIIWLFLGMIFLIIGISIIRSRIARYWVYSDSLEVRIGIFNVKTTNIPFEQIQNFNVIENPFHRFFDVLEIQIETASGSMPDATLQVISKRAYSNLKQKIETFKSKNNPHADNEPSDLAIENNLLKLSLFDLFTFGLVSNQGLPVVLAFGLLVSQFSSSISKHLVEKFSTYQSYIFDRAAFFSLESNWLILSGVLILGLILLEFILSIIMAIGLFYGYKLKVNNNTLIASYGSFNRINANIPLPRIQLIRASNGPIHRLMGLQSLQIETAGGNQSGQFGIEVKWIAPVIKQKKMAVFLQTLNPKILNITYIPFAQEKKSNWHTVAEKASVRIFRKSLVFTLLMATLVGFFWIEYSPLFLIVIPFLMFYAKRSAQSMLYTWDENGISFANGWLYRHVTWVAWNKVQGVELRHSPFDRHHHMMTLCVDTAGARNSRQRIYIQYLDEQVAKKLLNTISKYVTKTEFSWV